MTDPSGSNEASAVEFGDCKQMTAWLKTRETNVSVLIAERAALRVLPMLAADLRHVDGAGAFRSYIVLPVFRALAASWTMINYREVIDPAAVLGAANLRCGRGRRLCPGRRQRSDRRNSPPMRLSPAAP